MSKIHCIDFEFDHDYLLIGIHSTLDDYRMAYFLNQNLNIQLTRYKDDLDFEMRNCSFPLYKFEDESAFTSWSLISNKYVFTENVVVEGGNLFPEQTKISYLIPEKKQIDYFIKIYGFSDHATFSTMLHHIKKINHIMASYAIDPLELKSRDNLIF